jgi:hypothetical protein
VAPAAATIANRISRGVAGLADNKVSPNRGFAYLHIPTSFSIDTRTETAV